MPPTPDIGKYVGKMNFDFSVFWSGDRSERLNFNRRVLEKYSRAVSSILLFDKKCPKTIQKSPQSDAKVVPRRPKNYPKLTSGRPPTTSGRPPDNPRIFTFYVHFVGKQHCRADRESNRVPPASQPEALPSSRPLGSSRTEIQPL